MTKRDRPDHALTIAVIAFAAFGLGVLLTLGFHGTAEAGAAWVAAAATIAAVAAAVYAGFWAKEAYRIEETREDARITAEVARQADLFAAWPTTEVIEQGIRNADGTVRQSWGRVTRHVIAFRNASDLPVTNVAATIFSGGYIFDTLRIPLVPPGHEPVSERFEDLNNQLSEIEQPLQVHLDFVDAAGRRWQRLYGQPPVLVKDSH